MRLSYDPQTHRRCYCCRAVGGQYPLKKIIGGWIKTQAVVLECDHLMESLDEFKENHPDWVWLDNKKE